MNPRSEHSPSKASVRLLAAVAATAIFPFFCGNARAPIYDDFDNSAAIDAIKRATASPPIYFSQNAGRLRFLATANSETIRPTRVFGPGFFSQDRL
ncbi:MAG: hypothetical protein JW884_13400 [Deltaproteobacteria bacterium]|nr:hypothetical protein [Deltaproteobacteria bacterium]